VSSFQTQREKFIYSSLEDNDMDSLYTAFKIASMLATTVFGVIGLLTEFKDNEKKITKWGKVALAGILTSSVISFGMYFLESTKAKADAEKAKAEAEATSQKLKDILSSAQTTAAPIKDLRIGYSIYVPTYHFQLKGYTDRFNRELTRFNRELTSIPITFPPLPWIQGMTGDGKRMFVFDFGEDAPLAPNNDREKLAYAVLAYSGIELLFFKEPINLNSPNTYHLFDEYREPSLKPDLRLGVDGKLSSTPSDGHLIRYNMDSRTFWLQAKSLPSDSHTWNSNGKIIGIPDLLGTQMVVRVRVRASSRDTRIDPYVSEIRKSFELDEMMLSFSAGREFWFGGRMLQKHVDANGDSFYSFVFPKSLNQLRALEGRFPNTVFLR
jgi:hypothetical protein